MANVENRHSIVQYVEETGESFEDRPLGAVDALVCAQLAYFKWGRVPAIINGSDDARQLALASLCAEQHRECLMDVERNRALKLRLLTAVSASRRFRDVTIIDHVDHLDELAVKQFSATAFLLPEGSVFVAFRGTDSTLTGWRENFMLAFSDEVPAQAAAREHLERIAAMTDGPIYVGGHSKGGNLAVYSAATCSLEAFMRIAGVFDFDGPGFADSTFRRADVGRLDLIATKIVPVDSAVGVLLESLPADKVVKSTASGFEQHDLFSWVVRRGDFVYAEKTSEFSRRIHDTAADWSGRYTPCQLEHFADALFGMFNAMGVMKLTGLSDAETAARDAFLDGIDPSERALFSDMVEQLVRSSIDSFDLAASTGEFIEKELLPQNLTPQERFDELADKLDAFDERYR